MKSIEPSMKKKNQLIASKPSAVPSMSTSQHKVLLLTLTDDEPTWYQLGGSLSGRNATLASIEKASRSTKASQKAPVSTPKNRLTPSPSQRNDPVIVNKYRALADGIYKRELQLISNSTDKSADDRWVEATMHQGTLKDRIAAMNVLVSSDPIHKLLGLDGLLSLCGCTQSDEVGKKNSKPNSRVAQMAAESLEDLFVNTLLPRDRKLASLDQRPLYQYEQNTKKILPPRILLLWWIEELIRDKYNLFIRQYLTKSLRDGMELEKKFCLKLASHMLSSVPEGEGQLLQLLVNKLGDPNKKICADASHALCNVLAVHPAMKMVVAREVQQLAHRPNLSARALYNCIVFLNQLSFDSRKRSQELAGSLMTTYFRLFDVIVDGQVKKLDEGEVLRSRLLSALLTGVNRAHPFLPSLDQDLDAHMNTLYRVVHKSAPSARTQALLLLFHVAVSTTPNSSSDADITVSRAASKTNEEKTKRRDRFYRALYSTLSEPGMLGCGKHLTMYFNLLYKALKHDSEKNRITAFVKRLLVTSLQCTSPVSAASYFLVNEIAKHHTSSVLPCLVAVLKGSDANRILDPTKREPRGALIVKESTLSPDVVIDSVNMIVGLWEMSLSRHHYHPSVAKFASFVGGGELHYTGDPLKDFGLTPFLDKFSYRNPKSSDHFLKKVGNKGAYGTVGQRMKASLVSSTKSLPMNDPTFLQQKAVDEQDLFFHKFFVERARRDELKGIVLHKTKSENKQDGNTADAFEAEQNAFDNAEDFDGSNKQFNLLESQWNDDSEEEAFVDSLTQRIIEDSHGAKPSPVDFDDEDPDMDKWEDLNTRSHSEENDRPEMVNLDDHEDDDPDSETWHDSVASTFSDDDESINKGDVDQSDSKGMFDARNDGEMSKPSKYKRRKVQNSGVYAAIEEYEDVINDSWFSLSRDACGDKSLTEDKQEKRSTGSFLETPKISTCKRKMLTKQVCAPKIRKRKRKTLTK